MRCISPSDIQQAEAFMSNGLRVLLKAVTVHHAFDFPPMVDGNGKPLTVLRTCGAGSTSNGKIL